MLARYGASRADARTREALHRLARGGRLGDSRGAPCRRRAQPRGGLNGGLGCPCCHLRLAVGRLRESAESPQRAGVPLAADGVFRSLD
ncbi:MAG TPA: hypothetical protein VEL73_10245 [Mycobacteriales bacterium]|nr:hypothetical protein [Mycobacteriales bacterium]